MCIRDRAGVFLRKRRNPLLRRAQLSRQTIVLPAKLFLLTPGLLRLAAESVERRRASFRSGTAQRSQKLPCLLGQPQRAGQHEHPFMLRQG